MQDSVRNKITVGLYVLVIFLMILGMSYAYTIASVATNVATGTYGIDESIYGNTSFDSSNINFFPILDTDAETSDSVLKIDFKVRGAQNNPTNKNIIYDIALVDLIVDCELLNGEHIKWKLVKNNTEISNGSLSYSFDTIKNGRLVLTTIQQDLINYNSGYDSFSFYLWFSDSCQEEDITNCTLDDQSDVLSKYIGGKIEVELYTDSKKELVRKPRNVLDVNTCIQEYPITFNVNGGNDFDSTTCLAPATLDNGDCVKFVYYSNEYGYLPIPTWEHASFVGWVESPDSSEIITDVTKVSKLDTHQLYAKWNLINYTISYNLNGGTLASPINTYNVESDTFSIPTPVKTGYTFKGWTGSNGNTSQTSVVIEKGSAGDCSYTANWTANTYSITYNGNGNTSGSTSNSTHTYDTAKALTSNGFVRAGYSFNGWNTKADGSGTSYSNGASVKNLTSVNGGTVTLYAQWKSASNVLISGRSFNSTIKSGVTKTVFTTSIAPSGVTVTDLSAAGDRGIVGWVQSGTYYISSQRSGVKVKVNSNSDFMFSGNPNNTTFAGSSLWQNVTSHDLSNLDTSSATSFYAFFNHNKALTTITGLNNLNTANVTNMNALFYYCEKLTSLNLSSWNTSKVTNMQSVFNGCTSLTSVNVSGWDVDQVTNFSHTFCWTPKLATIDLSTWKTTSATDMKYMFAVYSSSSSTAEDYTGRSALSTLKLGSGWSTANVTNMRNMFFGCSKLTLNCKSWNVKKVTNHTQFNLYASNVTAPTWP